MAEEGLQKTDSDLIHIGNPIPFDEEELLFRMGRLMKVAYANREDDIRALVQSTVPSHHLENDPPEIVRRAG